MKNNISIWIEAYNSICRKENAHCPKCNSTNIQHEFRAKENQIGYALISCNDCKESIQISRLKFPENVETLPL